MSDFRLVDVILADPHEDIRHELDRALRPVFQALPAADGRHVRSWTHDPENHPGVVVAVSEFVAAHAGFHLHPSLELSDGEPLDDLAGWLDGLGVSEKASRGLQVVSFEAAQADANRLLVMPGHIDVAAALRDHGMRADVSVRDVAPQRAPGM